MPSRGEGAGVRVRPPRVGAGPIRTCLGCRRANPQARLIRLVRTADGFVEPDSGHRQPGRGAYLCRNDRCLAEALRRGRWAHAFRAPAALRPETAERVRGLIAAGERPIGVSVQGGC